MSLQHSKQIYPIERIIAAATYLTTGLAGFVWLIVAAIFKKNTTQFLQFHIFQSIFVSLAFYLATYLLGLVYIILYRIPLINAIPYFINMPLPFLFGLSIIQAIVGTVVLYLTITAFLGMYSYLPWFSNIINKNIGRR